MTDGRRLDPTELSADETGLDHEVGAAWAVARSLERALVATADSRPADGYVDRVMAALADEPAPARPALAGAMRSRAGLGGVLASIRAAWHVASEGSLRPRPRAAALAYVLSIVLVAGSVVGVAGYGLAGALSWLANPPSTAAPTLPGPTSLTAPSPSETNEPGESLEPGETPGVDGEPGDTGQPGGPDDHGDGSSGATSGEDHGGSTSGTETPSPSQGEDHGGGATPSSGTQTPKPTQTVEPTGTPRSTGTPKPTSTSGSGSGSGSGSDG